MAVVWQSNGAADGAGADVTLAPGLPTGLAAGDYMHLAVTSGAAFTATPPAGWTQIAAIAASNANELEVWEKVATAADATSAASGGTVSVAMSSTNSAAAAIHRFSGQNATPLSVAATTGTTASSVNQVAPTITPADADCLLVCYWATSGAEQTFTAPGTMTKRFDLAGISNNRDYSMATERLSGGSGAATGTRTATVPTAAIGRSVTVAIRPSGALFTLGIAGTATPAGSMAPRPQKGTSGTLTSTGALIKRAKRLLAGTITPAGSVAHRFVAIRQFVGTLTPVGTLVRRTFQRLSATLSPTGTQGPPRVFKRLSGTLTPAGVVTKKISRQLSGAITITGQLWRFVKNRFWFKQPTGVVLDLSQTAVSLDASMTGADLDTSITEVIIDDE